MLIFNLEFMTKSMTESEGHVPDDAPAKIGGKGELEKEKEILTPWARDRLARVRSLLRESLSPEIRHLQVSITNFDGSTQGGPYKNFSGFSWGDGYWREYQQDRSKNETMKDIHLALLEAELKELERSFRPLQSKPEAMKLLEEVLAQVEEFKSKGFERPEGLQEKLSQLREQWDKTPGKGRTDRGTSYIGLKPHYLKKDAKEFIRARYGMAYASLGNSAKRHSILGECERIISGELDAIMAARPLNESAIAWLKKHCLDSIKLTVLPIFRAKPNFRADLEPLVPPYQLDDLVKEEWSAWEKRREQDFWDLLATEPQSQKQEAEKIEHLGGDEVTPDMLDQLRGWAGKSRV